MMKGMYKWEKKHQVPQQYVLYFPVSVSVGTKAPRNCGTSRGACWMQRPSLRGPGSASLGEGPAVCVLTFTVCLATFEVDAKICPIVH